MKGLGHVFRKGMLRLMTDKNSPGRFAQLDTLRAFAVLVVMMHHYLDTRFFLSGFGATLFFVLSGYFVTKTLLRLKGEIATGKTNTGPALKTFYIQRWLRLWPLYYLVLALTLFLNVENARSSFLWNATFLSNAHVLLSGEWTGRFSPLWSLSVLEQFYLVWPAMILCCPRRHLLPLTLVTIAIGPVYRLLCLLFNTSPIGWCVVPFASFDLLGCGALLALCTRNVLGKAAQDRILWVAGRICMPAFLLLLAGKFIYINAPGSAVYIGTVASLAFMWLIHRTSMGFVGWGKVILENPLLSHMGRMSYSIFLLHNFTELLIPKIGILRPLLASNFKAVLLIPLTVLLAHVCWRLIETPILSFRRKYASAPAPQAHPEVEPGAIQPIALAGNIPFVQPVFPRAMEALNMGAMPMESL